MVQTGCFGSRSESEPIAARGARGRRSLLGGGAVFLACASACGSARYDAKNTGAPSLVVPIYVAEGDTGKPALTRAVDAGTPASATPLATTPLPRAPATLPDPDPLKTSHQWRYDLTYDKGRISVDAVERVELDRPMTTPRRIGRFAVELWVGKALLERVRFDFPLLASDPPPDRPGTLPRTAVRFGPGATTKARVLLPDSERATAARLVDRLTGASIPLRWPPRDAPDTPDGGG